MADHDSPVAAAVVDQASHLADKLPLCPDVHERIGTHGVAESPARKRKRRVAIAARALAARGRKAAREPDLREIQIRKHRSRRGKIEKRARQMSGAAAEVDG